MFNGHGDIQRHLMEPLCGSIATMHEQKTIPSARIAGLW
jgi:hypothetical protein